MENNKLPLLHLEVVQGFVRCSCGGHFRFREASGLSSFWSRDGRSHIVLATNCPNCGRRYKVQTNIAWV